MNGTRAPGRYNTGHCPRCFAPIIVITLEESAAVAFELDRLPCDAGRIVVRIDGPDEVVAICADGAIVVGQRWAAPILPRGEYATGNTVHADRCKAAK